MARACVMVLFPQLEQLRACRAEGGGLRLQAAVVGGLQAIIDAFNGVDVCCLWHHLRYDRYMPDRSSRAIARVVGRNETNAPIRFLNACEDFGCSEGHCWRLQGRHDLGA